MNTIAVCTTFGNIHWDIYAKQMLKSFVQNWPKDIAILVQLDDNTLTNEVSAILSRDIDAIAPGWGKEHAQFVNRNKGKDHETNYRFQATRFCHKVYTIARAYDSIEAQRQAGEPAPRYLIWLDADVHTTQKVTHEDLQLCLPKEGDAVSYMGRKDWDHSECGWLAFDLENPDAGEIIKQMFGAYNSDAVFGMKEQHDSWVFDYVLSKGLDKNNFWFKVTNLTPDATGMDVWPQSPMGKWSTHYKGPQAKAKLATDKKPMQKPVEGTNVIIQTRNAIPHEQIHQHIAANQALIKNWVKPCKAHDEEIVVVSAGPMLVAEDLRKEKGKKIVAVKHALTPLKNAGIKPWACILLDPRPHMMNFVADADPEIIWFVASQVNPKVTMQLLLRGCTVWGYHASVGAGETFLTDLQAGAVISGGSATATRGLFLLNHLGFDKMTLYGYDLCVPDKPDLNAKDGQGQPKYFEISVGMNDPLYNVKKMFWSEAQLIAQFEEINDLIKYGKFNLTAYGDGIVPFMIKAKKTSDLRRAELKAKITGENPPYYMDLLNGTAARPANAGA